MNFSFHSQIKNLNDRYIIKCKEIEENIGYSLNPTRSDLEIVKELLKESKKTMIQQDIYNLLWIKSYINEEHVKHYINYHDDNSVIYIVSQSMWDWYHNSNLYIDSDFLITKLSSVLLLKRNGLLLPDKTDPLSPDYSSPEGHHMIPYMHDVHGISYLKHNNFFNMSLDYNIGNFYMSQYSNKFYMVINDIDKNLNSYVSKYYVTAEKIPRE